MISFIYGVQKVKCKESGMVVTGGQGVGKSGRCWSESVYKLPFMSKLWGANEYGNYS